VVHIFSWKSEREVWDSVPDELERLAALVRIKNDADAAIAELIGRPSASGNISEFVAAKVFAIQLITSGSHPGHDGVFAAGSLVGKTVNIKTYSRHEFVLNISPIHAITISS
jgi:hypothetical protein